VPREKSGPGKLETDLTLSITTQEQAYRVLTRVPSVDNKMAEALLMAIAKGSEQYWVRTALTQGYFPFGAPSRQAALMRLSESSFDAMKHVLQQKDAEPYKNKIASRFSSTYDGSMMALALDSDWTQTQTIKFVSKVLPELGEKDAASLLYRSCVRSLPVEYRYRVVSKVHSWPYDPIDKLFTDKERFANPDPPWSAKERACLINVIIKSDEASHHVLFPYSWQKLHDWKFEEGASKKILSKKEKRCLAERAGWYIRLKLKTHTAVEHFKVEANELLTTFEDDLSQELKEEFKKYL
jgi:hypothetical protein